MTTPRPASKAPTRELLALFDTLHAQAFGVRAVIRGAKDATLIARLWKSHGDEMTRSLMARFFHERDPFSERAGYTVGVFISQAARLLLREAQKRPQPEPEDWYDECKRLHGGICGGQMKHSNRLDIDAERKARRA